MELLSKKCLAIHKKKRREIQTQKICMITTNIIYYKLIKKK